MKNKYKDIFMEIIAVKFCLHTIDTKGKFIRYVIKHLPCCLFFFWLIQFFWQSNIF